jgi:hypothetical protein
MKIESKWSYVLTGVNVSIAMLGAIIHSLPLLLMGGIFGFLNWVAAELNRSLEDEIIRKKSRSDSGTETEE